MRPDHGGDSMKFFDKLTPAVEAAFAERAVDPAKLKYCVKADLDADGCYYDVYITFDDDTLYLLCGYDRLVEPPRLPFVRRKAEESFDFADFSSFSVADIEKIYVDRYAYASRLMAKFTDGTERPLARFSAGFAEKFEQFCRRFDCLKKGETPDDSALEDKHLYCPKCGEKYPDPNRRFCPKCNKRSGTFLRLFSLFAEYKWQIAALVAMLLLAVALELIAPVFGTKMLYDDVLSKNGRLYGQLLYVILSMAAFSFVSMLFRIASGVVVSSIAPKVIHDLRVRIFSSMQRLSLSFFSNKQTGSLMGRVDRDSGDVYYIVTDIVPQFFSNIIKAVGLVVLMLNIQPVLSLCMFAVVFIILGIESAWFRGQHRMWRRCDVAHRGVNATLSDSMNGHRVVKAFAREEQEIGRFGKKNDALY